MWHNENNLVSHSKSIVNGPILVRSRSQKRRFFVYIATKRVQNENTWADLSKNCELP